jgi:CRISPR/Cas system-associated exonuclease Cas4 (RecB family)
MSQFYKPNRDARWNYGGPNWRLSRSKIDLFLECPKCFYIDNKLGTARPRLMTKYGVDAIPFEHKDMNRWRDNFKGVEYFHEPTGFTVSGAVDDVWINPEGELIVVDYKATSKDEKVNLDAEWQKGYKLQMEIYQWLMRKNNFQVSDTGYFVYANGRTDLKAFDGKLEFDVDLIPYTAEGYWNEDTLFQIKETLESDEIPKKGDDCEYCPYFYTRQEKESKFEE